MKYRKKKKVTPEKKKRHLNCVDSNKSLQVKHGGGWSGYIKGGSSTPDEKLPRPSTGRNLLETKKEVKEKKGCLLGPGGRRPRQKVHGWEQLTTTKQKFSPGSPVEKPGALNKVADRWGTGSELGKIRNFWRAGGFTGGTSGEKKKKKKRKED